jgi:hypothetical protein
MTPGAPARDLTAEIAFLTRALKAPTLRDCVDRLANRAREQGWSHEEFLVAGLQREAPLERATAVRAASAPPGSPAARAWRTSTSTTPEDSSAS